MIRLLFFLVLSPLLNAQTQPELVQTWVLSQPWRFHLGDNPHWKDPAFDDSGWATLLPSKRWTDQGVVTDPSGFAWYRLEVTIETAEPLYLWFPELKTSADVFVNGVKVMQYGVPGDIYRGALNSAPLAQLPPLKPGDRALVAVRVWLGRDEGDSHIGGGISIPPQLGPHAPMQQAFHLQSKEIQRDFLGFLLTGLLGVFLALVLIVCWRRQPRHAEYGWYAGMLLGRALFDLLWYGLFALGFYRGMGLFVGVAYAANLGCSCFFFRSYFGAAHPRWFRWVLGACLLLVTADGGGWVDWLVSTTTNSLLIAGHLPILAANAWLLFGEGRKGNREAWFLGLPYLLYASGLLVRVTWYLLIFSGIWYSTAMPSGGLILMQEPISVPLELAGLGLGSLAMTGILLNRFTRIALDGERLTKELEAARQVQELLLPAATTKVPGFAVASAYLPANEVGGDFYQLIPCEPNGLLVVAGDVSGKGLKAAMLVSVAIGILRNEKSASPGAVLAALNDGLTGHTAGGFVTCCCARFASDGTVTIANAGHPAPYCDGQELTLEAGLPLGIAPRVEYAESVSRGVRFTFVSDGVVEAENAQRELFGFDRTREISGKSAQEIAEAAKAWGQNDDITVVTVRRSL